MALDWPWQDCGRPHAHRPSGAPRPLRSACQTKAHASALALGHFDRSSPESSLWAVAAVVGDFGAALGAVRAASFLHVFVFLALSPQPASSLVSPPLASGTAPAGPVQPRAGASLWTPAGAAPWEVLPETSLPRCQSLSHSCSSPRSYGRYGL